MIQFNPVRNQGKTAFMLQKTLDDAKANPEGKFLVIVPKGKIYEIKQWFKRRNAPDNIEVRSNL